MSLLTRTEQEEFDKYYNDVAEDQKVIDDKTRVIEDATAAKIKKAKLQCQRMFNGYEHTNPDSSATTTICWKVNKAIIKYWNDNNSNNPINDDKVTKEAFEKWKQTQQNFPHSWSIFRLTFKKAYEHFNNENADTKKRCREQIWKDGVEGKKTKRDIQCWKVSDAAPLTQIAVASSDNNQKYFIYRILAEEYDSYDSTTSTYNFAEKDTLSLDELYNRISKLRYQLGGNYRTHTHQGTLEEVMRGTSLHKDSKESNSKLFMINLDTNFATAFENYMTERKFVKKDFQNIFINYDAYTVSQVKPKRKRYEIEDENNSLKKQKQDDEEEKQKLEVENKKLKKQKRKVEKNVWNCKELMLIILPTKPCLLEYASSELKNDPEIVKLAVSKDGYALQFASSKLKNDKKIVKKAVSENGLALQYASEELQNNEKIVKKAVSKCGFAFNQDRVGTALRYASEELKNDPEIVKIAVSKNGYALRYASPELQQNTELIALANH